MLKELVSTALIAGVTLVGGHPFMSTNDVECIDAEVSLYTPQTSYIEMVDREGFTWAFEDCQLDVEVGEKFEIIYLTPEFIPVSIESKEGGKEWDF